MDIKIMEDAECATEIRLGMNNFAAYKVSTCPARLVCFKS
jgi:hypothetical protein